MDSCISTADLADVEGLGALSVWARESCVEDESAPDAHALPEAVFGGDVDYF